MVIPMLSLLLKHSPHIFNFISNKTREYKALKIRYSGLNVKSTMQFAVDMQAEMPTQMGAVRLTGKQPDELLCLAYTLSCNRTTTSASAITVSSLVEVSD